MTCSLIAKTLAVITLNFSACATAPNDQLVEAPLVHPDFIGETNVWQRLEKRPDTWFILLTDDRGNRTKIEFLTYPGRDTAPIHVKYPCADGEKIYHVIMLSGADSGQVLEHCDEDETFFRQDMIVYLEQAPIAPDPLMPYVLRVLGANDQELENWLQSKGSEKD